MDGRTVPAQLRVRFTFGGSGQTGVEQTSDTSAVARRRRRYIPQRRKAVRLEERSGVEDYRGLGAAEQTRALKIIVERRARPGLSRPHQSRSYGRQPLFCA